MVQQDFLEKTTVNLLSQYKKQDLIYAIQDNISLAELIRTFIPSHIIKTIRLAISLMNVNGETFAYENVMNLLNLTRPDLYNVIVQTQQGDRWLKKNIRDMRRLFGV
jgi:hypothetical protein